MTIPLPLMKTTQTASPLERPTVANIWTAGEEGYPVYTIPGLLVTRRGTALACAEARQTRGDGGRVDLAIKRSLDGGTTWQNSTLIERARGHENYVLATMVEDRRSGRVFCFCALRRRGLADTETINTYRTSDDDGITWSDPHDITHIVHEADARLQARIHDGTAGPGFEGEDPALYGRRLVFFGPGRSIQMSATHPRFPHRMVVPLFYMKDRNLQPRGRRGYGDAVLVSDDGGGTWFVPGTAPIGEHGSSEVSVAEVADGRLVLNARCAPPASTRLSVASRTVSYSSDGGATWTRPRRDTSGIPDHLETSCGLLRASHPATDPQGRSRLLFSFPNALPNGSGEHGTPVRRDGTILMSYDEGQSWPVRKLLVPGSFGYSNMDLLPDGSVLLVHEDARGTRVDAVRFTIEWLTSGRDGLAMP
jgi:hypothetical protein